MPDRGNHLACSVVHGITFQVPKNFRLLEPVSAGPSFLACSAQDHRTGEIVQVKKVEDVALDPTAARRVLRDVRLLRNLRHENILDLRQVLAPSPIGCLTDMYVVTELLEADLGSVLKSSQEITEEHRQFFLYQILRGMKYVHSAGVVHFNLRPWSLLVDSNCDLKISDFTMAHFCENEHAERSPEDRVLQSVRYKAPEVLCLTAPFGKPCDVWSIGCIFAELLKRTPIFKGQKRGHQLLLILQGLGQPGQGAGTLRRAAEEAELRAAAAAPTAREIRRAFVADFAQDSRPEAQDVLASMLALDPQQRPTVQALLTHPYLHLLHAPDDEPESAPLDASDATGFCGTGSDEWSYLRQELLMEVLHYVG
mmetsp:Transcript_19047/g.44461  ORF Transcript_19047/g.44461 Transcript_19047/m.44461 type:complete len:367 (+) Transcript_19047:105-1205(+)